MEESLAPPDAEGNIFDQFDVQVTGELLPGGASIVDGYFCRLPPCHGEKRVFRIRRALIMHRLHTHSLPHTGTYKIPEGDQIRQWLRSGKPRPYEIAQHSPEHTKSLDRPGPSLLSKLLHCKPDTESELQPASLESNIYEQFNVRHEPGEAGGSPYVGFVCLLSQCHEEKVCLNTYAKWTRHRRSVHKETEEAQSINLPDGYEIRDWVILNKPRPYKVPVRLKAWKKVKLCPVDPAVFAEFDVKGTVLDDEQLRFFCLLDPCKELGVSFQGGRCWKKHRVKHHMSPKYEDGEYTLPSAEIIKDWMIAGKPPHYKPQRRVRTFISVDPPLAKTSTEIQNGEVNPTPNNVGNQVNGQKSQVLCLFPGSKDLRIFRSGNQQSQGHHQELQKLLPLEGRPSLRSSKRLARLGKFRPSTPPDEISRESRRRGRRPRNADAAGCSSDTEPAHQKKKKRRSIRSANRSHSIDSTDSDSSDLVALRVVARGDDPNGGFWKQFLEETNPIRDETPPSDDFDQESDDGSDNVDDLSVDQTVDDPTHDHSSADMKEPGGEPREDSARPEDDLSSLPYSQPELPDSGAADVVEVDEDAHEEFEAPDNVLPSQPELQNVKVVGHFGVHPQDFRGVTEEHQQNSTAQMADADEESPKISVVSENVLPSLQNSTAEMGEVEEEEPEDFVSPENALNALTYSQPKLWEHSSVQPKDFQGDVLETLPNPTAEMDEVKEEAPEDSVAIENVQSSLSCLQPEFGITGIVEHDNVLPQGFPEEIHGMLPNTQMAEFGEAHEEFINPWNLHPSVSSDVSEQIVLSPLWHLDGDTFESLPQDFPGENWPNSSKEDNLQYSAEMAEFDEKAPEETVAVGSLSLSVQSESSEQNVLSTLRHYFRDALQFSPEESAGESDNHRPNSNAEMAEVGEETPNGFVAPGNFVPWIPLVQSEGTKVPSLEAPMDIQAAPIQEFFPLFSMDQVFGPKYAAGMAEVGEETPEGFVAPENLAPWIPLVQSEGNKVPRLEGPFDIQAAPIQEFVPLFSMDPVFIEESSAARMNEVGEEALEEFAAPGNLVPLLPSNAPQETSEQLYVSILNTNASSQDPRNIQNETLIDEFLWTAEFIHTDIAFMNELAVLFPFAPSTQPEGREIGSIFMEGSTENSRENQVDPIQELTTIMDVGSAFESEPDLPLIYDREENTEEFFRLEDVALWPQPMQQLFSRSL